jgi:hypothetical protein
LSRRIMSAKYHIPVYSPLIYLYYPVRLKDVLLKNGKVIWQLVFGNKKTRVLAEKVNEASLLREWLLSG